ncbi:MAG: undecaprenyl-phosphate glucose phosphotransferase [Verrucomicrobia bacterium]|nr:undecaprenyl-phosphate glucose phosphotransferase [Verrucomicrobiota bacterium]
MAKRDTLDALNSWLAGVCDAIAIYAGFLLAVWIRFYSGRIPMFHEGLPPMHMYYIGSAVGTGVFLVVFRSLGLYARPQFGHFTEKIPRIIRAAGFGLLLSIALAEIARTETPYARIVEGLSLFTVTLLVIIERNILFQLERHWAKYQAEKKNVVIVGTDSVAVHLRKAIEHEPRLRSRLGGFFTTNGEEPAKGIPKDFVKGSVDGLAEFMAREHVDEVYVSNPSSLPHKQMVDIIVLCEKNLANFQMVPDMFRVLTSHVDVQSVGGIPLLGIGKWPLDHFSNRVLKRMEDVAGSLVGVIVSVPIVAVAAILVKVTSKGPAFYKQERCGESGRSFNIYKLRTMKADAEDRSGPVWAAKDDSRRTRVGSALRAYNLDELPQFWNVLKGDMSLVGPRPERPHFVEQFKEDISRYMWRHVSKPGMTGWAQVNGLRGNTSIQERIKYDLYYLENWSLAFDFKILLKTFFSRENAY